MTSGISKINVEIKKSANFQTYGCSMEYVFESPVDQTTADEKTTEIQNYCREHVMNQIDEDKRVHKWTKLTEKTT